MFQIDEDKTIYVTRGDIAFFSVSAEADGELYKFKHGDVVRMKVFDKKNCENVAFQKDFAVMEECERVNIFLSEDETKIGDVISKAKDYWYEIELNPYTNPQTIIGYDDDGAKIFKLFPEGKDLGNTTKAEDIPVVDSELSMTSTRPVENQAVTRGITEIRQQVETGFVDLDNRLRNLQNTSSNVESIDEEIEDAKRDIDGITYNTLGESIRGQISKGVSDDKVEEVVNAYVQKNGIEVGATPEQARQIEANTEQIEVNTEQIAQNTRDLKLKVSSNDVVDHLDSTTRNFPLSANQGRVLRERIEDISTVLTLISNQLSQLQDKVNKLS